MTAPVTAPATTTTVPPPKGMTAAQMATILAAVQAQAAMRAQLTQIAIQGALALLQPFTGWWSDDQVRTMMRRVVRLVQPAQRSAATFTDAYLTRVSTEMLGRRVTPAGAVNVTKLRADMTREIAQALVDRKIRPVWIELGHTDDGPSEHINDPAPALLRIPVSDRPLRRVPTLDPNAPYQNLERRYVDPVTPYQRIAEQYRYQVVSEGVPEDKARDKALFKLAIAVETDVTLAVREQYHKTMGRHKSDGYRRVLHPELSKSGPCGRCVVAADRTYHVADLLPIHSNCVCEVLPVYGELDPGINLNASDLMRLYKAAANRPDNPNARTTAGAKLQNVKVGFEGSRTIPGAENRLRAQLDQLERSYETLVHRSMSGEPMARSMHAQAARITQIRDELGLGPSDVAPRTETPPMRKARVVLTEHAELGPVLVDGDQHYRGPVEVAETKVPDRKVRAQAQLDSLEKSYAKLLDRYTSGDVDEKPVRWQRDKIADLRRELGLPVG